jgi:hypothetical protein
MHPAIPEKQNDPNSGLFPYDARDNPCSVESDLLLDGRHLRLLQHRISDPKQTLGVVRRREYVTSQH